MSKTNPLRRKATGLDIFSRILTCLAAIAIPVVSYFAGIIYYVVQSDLWALISKFQGKTDDDGSTEGYISIRKVVEDYLPLLKGNVSSETKNGIWQALSPIHTALIIMAVLFCLALVCALVIFFMSAFSNSNKMPLITSTIGFVCALAMPFAFRGVSSPIVDGTISIASLFGMTGDSLAGTVAESVIPMIAKVTILNLSTAWVVMLVLFLGILIWHGAMILIDDTPKDKKLKKKEKKA